jgi:hypothetical protein
MLLNYKKLKYFDFLKLNTEKKTRTKLEGGAVKALF